MKVWVEIDEKEYGLLCTREEAVRLQQALNALYGLVWPEACQDATNAEWEKFARRLLPYITEANHILKFKK